MGQTLAPRTAFSSVDCGVVFDLFSKDSTIETTIKKMWGTNMKHAISDVCTSHIHVSGMTATGTIEQNTKSGP